MTETPIKDKEKVEKVTSDGKVELKEYSAVISQDFDTEVDPFYLQQKDPEFAYRFLRNEQKNLSEKTTDLVGQKGGWQLCPTEHLLRIGIHKDRLHPDGHYYAGENILAFMPKWLYEKKEEIKRKRADGKMKQIDTMIGDPKKGIKAKGDPALGIRTKEQMGSGVNWK